MDLISGASGFIGRRLVRSLQADGVDCRGLGRKAMPNLPTVVADLADRDALMSACEGVTRVFHCAGYAHAFSARSSDEAQQHWRVNFEGTRNLVEAAGRAGVKRFVFLSSIKAMADPGEACADEQVDGAPDTAYGASKRAAEDAVIAAGQRYNMHAVNLRLSMVYGAGGRGNLERMARLVKRGVFPPLPETGNHRSLVHVDDVVSAMRLVADDARAAGKTYIVTGPESPSGRALFDALRAACGLPTCSWSIPAPILQLAARSGDILAAVLKRRFPLDSEVLKRLLESAWYSSAKIEQELGWHPQVSLVNGLSEMLRNEAAI